MPVQDLAKVLASKRGTSNRFGSRLRELLYACRGSPIRISFAGIKNTYRKVLLTPESSIYNITRHLASFYLFTGLPEVHLEGRADPALALESSPGLPQAKIQC